MRFGSPLLRRVDGWVMGAALVELAAGVSYGHVHDGDGQVLPYAAARERQEELRSLHLSASECFPEPVGTVPARFGAGGRGREGAKRYLGFRLGCRCRCKCNRASLVALASG